MDDSECNFEASSKKAALVESHCEYLTCIRHNVSQRTQVARGSFKTLEDYIKDYKCKLNTKGLLHLIVELAYFLYACKIYQVRPNIDCLLDLRVEEKSYRNSQKRFSVVIWYKIEEEQGMQQGETMQGFIQIFNYIQEKLRDYLNSRVSEREGSMEQIEHEQNLELFCNQFEMLADNKYFQEHESLFFLCLQQTALFYEISLMYRIKNCSILDFIKTDESKLSIFRVSKVKDESLVVQFNKENNLGKSQPEVLTAKEKQIENNISQFFRSINQKQYFQLQSKNEKDKTYRVKFNYTIRQREKYAFEQMVQSMQGANVFRNDSKRLMQCRRVPSQIQFFIEYSSQKNQICVRLYNLALMSNYQSYDYLIFQSNVFTYESFSISIELTEPKIKGSERSNKKVITFKGTSFFDEKSPPLERIILLMDVTMIASKVYQPQLMNRHGSSISKDFQRLSNIQKKINHYTKLFLKCAKKVYSELGREGSDQS